MDCLLTGISSAVEVSVDIEHLGHVVTLHSLWDKWHAQGMWSVAGMRTLSVVLKFQVTYGWVSHCALALHISPVHKLLKLSLTCSATLCLTLYTTVVTAVHLFTTFTPFSLCYIRTIYWKQNKVIKKITVVEYFIHDFKIMQCPCMYIVRSPFSALL